jgi:hypothetical protein
VIGRHIKSAGNSKKIVQWRGSCKEKIRDKEKEATGKSMYKRCEKKEEKPNNEVQIAAVNFCIINNTHQQIEWNRLLYLTDETEDVSGCTTVLLDSRTVQID